MEYVRNELWQAAEASFEKIIRTNPEYILFRSISLISRDINHHAHASVVNRIRQSRSYTFPQVWRDEFVLRHAFHLVNAALQVFLVRVDNFIKDFEESSLAIISCSTCRDQARHPWRLCFVDGCHTFPDTNQTEKSRMAFLMADEKPAAETGGRKTVVDQYLVWRRGEQNWRYTFYEGIYEFPNQTAADRLSAFLVRFLSSASLEASFSLKGRLATELDDEGNRPIQSSW